MNRSETALKVIGEITSKHASDNIENFTIYNPFVKVILNYKSVLLLIKLLRCACLVAIAIILNRFVNCYENRYLFRIMIPI